MLQVIKACILKYLRRRKQLLFNIFFPVFLIIVLGMTLQNNFENTTDNEAHTIEVLYVDNGNEYSKEALKLLKDMSSDYNIKFLEEDSAELAKQKVRATNAVFLELDGDKINFYANDKYLTDSSIVFGILKGVTNGINATVEIFKVDPEKVSSITAVREDDIFNMESIAQAKSPTAIDYYGIAELGLMMFYYFSLPLYSLREEKKKNIKDRIKIAGISVKSYYFGTFIGNSLMAFSSVVISYVIARYALGVNYGSNILAVPLAALPFITLIISLGILLSLVVKDEERGMSVGSAVVIPVLCFLGGGYIPIGDGINPIFNILTKISPLRWFNNGLFRYIYGGNNSMFIWWLVIGTVVTAILLMFIYVFARKEELAHE